LIQEASRPRCLQGTLFFKSDFPALKSAERMKPSLLLMLTAALPTWSASTD
jgi:hypothetical protein